MWVDQGWITVTDREVIDLSDPYLKALEEQLERCRLVLEDPGSTGHIRQEVAERLFGLLRPEPDGASKALSQILDQALTLGLPPTPPRG